ncbi:hypothetical protein [Asticcacaulis benevestitus]|uniref:Uncharacterized protein n=1 Tax=Asticcacaulis benevestitus DSM 16100 = ATCC BAA-896 TaxID=1121022 RepID=V4P403_9CAUL|nr:hypothetical protein [Asticcacaulis benevestitus]ESQ88672.1 hypothetical protein ABENE_15635 [Asticcacaulis benevestitus DSM 16100 = ATCC BAA-896]
MEAEIRADPLKPADQFVHEWARMDAGRIGADGSGDTAMSNRMRGQMGAMAKSLERDPQMDSRPCNQRIALGLSGVGAGGHGAEPVP